MGHKRLKVFTKHNLGLIVNVCFSVNFHAAYYISFVLQR